MSTPIKPLLVTREEAARLLGCSPKHIDDLRNAQKIVTVQTGIRGIRITYASLEAYVASLTEA